MATQEFVFKSKSNPRNSYKVILHDDGTTSCNCRGWTIKKSGKERECRHTKEVEANGGTVAVKAPAAPKPRYGIVDVEPMKAGVLDDDVLGDALMDESWVAEEKLDGARYVLHLLKDSNRIFSRNKSTVDGLRNERTDNVPHLRDLKHKLIGTILDGEIVAKENGKSDDTTRIMGAHPQRAIEAQEKIGFVTYKVFDILEHKGKDLRALAYWRRYDILQAVLKQLGSKYLVLPKRTIDNKQEFFDDILKAGGEGVILKHVEGRYIEGGRGLQWIKIKRESNWNVIAMELTKGKGAFRDTFGAIVFGMYIDGKLTEMGKASGMTLKVRQEVSDNWNGYEGNVFEITGQEITKGKRVRHPRFKQWRPDVDPKTVTYEDESKSI